MNNKFEIVGRELTDEELTLIQGGNIFGDIWDGVKKAVGAGAKAIADGLANKAIAEAKRFFSRWF